jgi:tetratricopeptide (TPR) repeat protein
MRRRWSARDSARGWALCGMLLAGSAGTATVAAVQGSVPEEARRAYESSDYRKAVQVLQAAATSDPRNGDVDLLLTKSYLELQEFDAAINSAEKAVGIDPQSSEYHEWLGRAYGEKASRASMFSAVGLAKKTRKEFDTAVQLDDKNYSARQALIEFDCSAPGMVGGGEDKAKPEIEKLHTMDVSEWHYALGNCRRQKKDYATADNEFEQALQSDPKSVELIYDVGDYAVRHNEADRLLEVAQIGGRVAPSDVRGKFYRATGLILKKENLDEAEKLLREYLSAAPKRNAFPRYSVAHEWLGRLFEEKGERDAAAREYQAALQLDAKDKNARDALKRLGKG